MVFIIESEKVLVQGQIFRNGEFVFNNLTILTWNIDTLVKVVTIIFLFQDREKEVKLPLKEVSVEEILDAQRREQEQRQDKHRLISKALKERGLSANADLISEDCF